MTEAKKKSCISIGPYGADPAGISHRHDLEILLKEILSTEFEYKAFWEVPNTDMTSDLFNAIVEADLVIADLRGLNPNVMYELGIRHAFNKPTVHLRDDFTKLSWDIDKNFTVPYPLPIQLSHKEKLVSEIKDRIQKVLSLDPKSNPSYSTLHSVLKTKAQIASLPSTVDSDLKEVLGNMTKQISYLNSKVDKLNVSGNNQVNHNLKADPAFFYVNSGLNGLNSSNLNPLYYTNYDSGLGVSVNAADTRYTGISTVPTEMTSSVIIPSRK